MKELLLIMVILLQGCASVWEFAPSQDDYLDVRNDASHVFCGDSEVKDLVTGDATRFSCISGPSLVQLDDGKSLSQHKDDMDSIGESVCPGDEVRRYSSINGRFLIDCASAGRKLVQLLPLRSLSGQLDYIEDLKTICPDTFRLRSVSYPRASRRVAEFTCGGGEFRLVNAGSEEVQSLDAAVCGLEGFQSLNYNLNNAEYVCKSGETGVVGI